MPDINELFVHNRAWAAEMERTRPGFFTRLTQQQKSKFMWIGCSDGAASTDSIEPRYRAAIEGVVQKRR